ncbi:MAG: 50S ribosomal protein L4 [Thermodesulfobacteriota bacterium]|nr:50S ribosomal protein L4 [Thermodesulfobacteriota bacterium]
MAVVDVLNASGEKVSETDLPDEIFTIPVKKGVLHDVVKMQLASRRRGTASVKGRSEVRGSTKKLYRQKGTGNARAGSIKSPLRRGGGVIFGPTKRSFAYKVPKKVRALALKMALSSKYANKEISIIDQFGIDTVKTREFVSVKNALGLKNILIVISEEDTNLMLSSKNVADVKVIKTEGLNVFDILKYENLLLLESSIEALKGRFAS